ncbi:hypothetical protein Pcinc_008041 [Petrolisthes cinctipes]|uniref:Uncharacterized protein n=1 Tax=Petrolisthes cinctipes TaxID=88211 RepID=A0AAE1G9Q9_PETCI|nr:hypothetical protein Pcinc_008041 [Petrolisthes cinctipes]
MQCANIFFILSIGFAPAALACSEASADQSMTRMKIISPENSFEVSTSEGIIRNKFELKEGKAASVMCPCIHLPHPEHQRLVISDELTGDELYSSDSESFMADEEYIILENDFTIVLTESEESYSDPQQARPQVECSIARHVPGQN